MIEKNVFYTSLEKVKDQSDVYKYYEIHYFIELEDQIPTSFDVKPHGGSTVTLKPLLGNNYELIGLQDTVAAGKEYLYVLLLESKFKHGHNETISGTIKVKKSKGGGDYKEVTRWDKIAVKFEHDHDPVLTHNGTSTPHLGDGD